jgi:SAM-dependent methyltransferase
MRATIVRNAPALARRLKRSGIRSAFAIHPARWIPGGLARYRDSWRSRDVARQMVELTDSQLLDPDTVPPYCSFRTLLERLVADDGLPRPARFIDVGCGAGAYGELVERWAPGRFDYVGADYSEEILEAARKRAPSRTFVRRDVHDEHAFDGFDVVFASALVDVLPDYEAVLDALCAADAPWVVLHRQRIGERSHVEIAPGYRGQRTYRSYVTREQLERVAARHRRRIAATVPVDEGVHSFILAR